MWSFHNDIDTSADYQLEQKYDKYVACHVKFYDTESSTNREYLFKLHDIIREIPDFICLTIDNYAQFVVGYSFLLNDKECKKSYASYYHYIAYDYFDILYLRVDIHSLYNRFKAESNYDDEEGTYYHTTIEIVDSVGKRVTIIQWKYMIFESGKCRIIDIK